MQSSRGFEYGVRHIISPTSGPVVDVLLGILELSREELLSLVNLGSIYVNHQRISENIPIDTETYVRVHSKPRRFPKDDGQWKSRVLFENDHFIVVNKIAGLPVHASVDNTQENLLRYVSDLCGHTLYITHRLDVPTQGLIVFAKTLEFQSAFNKLLIERNTKKIYRARVQGLGLTTGLVRHFMEPSPRAPKKIQSQEAEGWQECLLEILDVAPEETSSLVTISLLTGRTHQIRAQLSALGFPILGDTAYGSLRKWDEERIDLQACELEFENPLTGEKHSFKI